MQTQPYLFFELALTAPVAPKGRGGKTVVEKLLKIRRGLNDSEKDYLAQINSCIEEIRSFSRINDTQLEEIVLFALERQGCTTLTEIVEETRVNKEKIFKTLKFLQGKKLIRVVRKYIPNSDKPNYSFKSNRVSIPEA